ncbi:MAG: hypothetical protein D6722_17835, partial [Bacteroidetes bacterium]
MRYILPLLLLLGWHPLLAQGGWALSGQLDLRHTQSDLTPDYFPSGPTSLTPAAQLRLERRLRPAWRLRLEGHAGWLQGTARPYDWQGAPLGDASRRAQAFNFRSQTAGGSLQLGWHPLARRRRRW